MSSPDLLRRVVLPIAGRDDARETCRAALPYIANADGEAIAVFVVETTPGGMNKASPVALKEYGERALGIVEECNEEYAIPVRTEVRYGSVVREAVFDVARSEEATSIGFLPRAGSRIGKFLSGDKSLSMITRNDLPVVVFPRETPLTEGVREEAT